jgi:predicted RNA-binding protein with PIN domain
MPRLVDGDNLLGTWPGRSRAAADKRALAREIDAFTRRDGRPCVVVFDGVRPEGIGFAADTVFSGPGRSADEVILSRLRESADPRGVIVVTHDRSLADRCRALGARIESPRDFRARLSAGGSGEKPAREDDVKGWLETFGGEPSEE